MGTAKSKVELRNEGPVKAIPGCPRDTQPKKDLEQPGDPAIASINRDVEKEGRSGLQE